MITIIRLILVRFAFFAAYGFSLASNAQEPARIALVIGNSTYSEFSSLETPGNDARRIAGQLADLGFSVEGGKAQLNLNRKQMLDALEKFYVNARIQRGVALLYYGGHGVAIDGANYLLPTDTPKSGSNRIEDDAISLDRIMRRIRESGAQFGVLVVDACRTNPFPNSGTRGDQDGLVPVSPPRGMAVLYSAEATRPAYDAISSAGVQGAKLSPFAQVFSRALSDHADKEFSLLVQVVREDVEKLAARSGKQQYPAFYNEMGGSFYFKHKSAQSFAPPSEPKNLALIAKSSPEAANQTRSIAKSLSPITEQEALYDYLKAGFAAYSEKRYQDAADLFERVSVSAPKWYYALRWQAISICASTQHEGLALLQRTSSLTRGDIDILRCLAHLERLNGLQIEALATDQRIIASSAKADGSYREIVVGPTREWAVNAQWNVSVAFRKSRLSLSFTNGWIFGENLQRWKKIKVGIYDRSSTWKELHTEPCWLTIPVISDVVGKTTIFAPANIGNFSCDIKLISGVELDQADIVVSFVNESGGTCNMFAQPKL